MDAWTFASRHCGSEFGWRVLKRKVSEIFPTTDDRRRVYSVQSVCLLQDLLTCDPAKRITAEQALSHAYFAEAPEMCASQETQRAQRKSHGSGNWKSLETFPFLTTFEKANTRVDRFREMREMRMRRRLSSFVPHKFLHSLSHPHVIDPAIRFRGLLRTRIQILIICIESPQTQWRKISSPCRVSSFELIEFVTQSPSMSLRSCARVLASCLRVSVGDEVETD